MSGILPPIKTVTRTPKSGASQSSQGFAYNPATGPLQGTTIHYNLNLVNFDWITWHTYEHENWQVVDALLYTALLNIGVSGFWQPYTDYTAGILVIDPTDPNLGLMQAQVDHTSSDDLDADKAAGKWISYSVSDGFVERAGDTMLGPLNMAQDAVGPLEPVTLQQFDAGQAVQDSALAAHEARVDNPHAVTYQQLGGTQPAPIAHTHIEADIIDLNRMRWRGEWVNGSSSFKNDVWRDGDFTMVANKDTTDRPAPVDAGPETWVYDGAAPEEQISAKTLLVQNTYTLPVALKITGYRFYAITGNDYAVFLRDDATGTVTELIAYRALQDGWHEYGLPGNIIEAGASFTLGVYVTEPDPSSVVYALDYQYVTPNNATDPAPGQIQHASKEQDVMRVHRHDLNGDQTAALDSMTTGNVIEDGGIRWSISAISVVGDVYHFTVAPAKQSTGGTRTFNFETVTETPITTVVDSDFYLGDASVQPAYRINNDPVIQTDDGYGVDIEYQEITVSPDFDVLAINGESSAGDGGGGGVTTFEALIDTPIGYGTAGQALFTDGVGAIYFGDPSGADAFVKKIGDTMTGPLVIDALGLNALDATGNIKFQSGDAEVAAQIRTPLATDPLTDAQVVGRRALTAAGGTDQITFGGSLWDQIRIVAKSSAEQSIAFYSGGTFLDASIGSDGFFLWNSAGEKTTEFLRNGAIINYTGDVIVDRRGTSAAAAMFVRADGNQNATFRAGSQDGSTNRTLIGRLATTDYMTVGATGWGRAEYICDGAGRHSFFCGTGNEDVRISTGRLRVYSGGTAQVDIDGGNFQSIAIRDNTTTNNANVRVATAGSSVMRSTSSGRYKKNVRPLADASTDVGATVDALRPRVFQPNSLTKDAQANLGGFITEELAEDFPLAVEAERAEHGEAPQNYDERAIVALLTAELQYLRQRVSALEKSRGKYG